MAVERYSAELLEREFSDSAAQHYLASYLGELSATTVVLESHYVDRHYLADFSAYYSRSFNAPSPHCKRLHFFSITPEEVSEHFANAYKNSDARVAAERALEAVYLGFVVVRPLSSAHIGRAVLKTYPPDGARRYEVVRPYRVNLAGLRLVIEGLAYQQQDQGAAVCASTALWSALQRVAYVAGYRTPAPTTITTAAKSPFPASHGLNDIQMATALSELGYIADQFAPDENRDLFRAKVVACLESQLPVVLLIERPFQTGAGYIQVGHAVTVTGFRENRVVIDVPAPSPGVAPIKMRSASTDVIYVHDDNLGSHAHYELIDSDETNYQGYKKLKLQCGRTDRPPVHYWEVREWDITLALVPKPEKMRMPIEALFGDLIELRAVIEGVFENLEVYFSARFTSGVDYKRSLFDQSFTPTALQEFMQRTSLPRHIGIISVHLGDDVLCEYVLDVSEVPRNPIFPSVIAVVAPAVPQGTLAGDSLTNVAQRFRCALLMAPPVS